MKPISERLYRNDVIVPAMDIDTAIAVMQAATTDLIEMRACGVELVVEDPAVHAFRVQSNDPEVAKRFGLIDTGRGV